MNRTQGAAPEPTAAARREDAGLSVIKRRAEWMTHGPFGMMVHWIAPGPGPEHGEWIQDLDRAVDAFDVARFLRQFQESGAAWLIFTIGQNSGCYASPNAVLDELAGKGHCSRRDLVLEIARGVHAQGKRFIAYLPSEVNAQSDAIHAGFAWNPKDQREFQQRYTRFIRAYSERFGKLCDGWWFDGCYTWDVFHNSLYDWPLWFSASRAGNPDCAVAFNDGCFCVGKTTPVTPLQDYLSGEAVRLHRGRILFGDRGERTFMPSSQYATGTESQWHVLTSTDCFWGHNEPGPMEPPRYTDDELAGFVRACRSVKGAVTLNVGIYQEGHLSDVTVAQLRRIAAAVA